MKITTLIENHPDTNGRYICEHGLSLLIETDTKRFLMDTGQTGSFYDNAIDQGISLAGLDGLILSHGHYDHTGGVLRLLQELPQEKRPARIYLGDGFFVPKYCEKVEGQPYYNGAQFDQKTLESFQVPLQMVEQEMCILGSGVTLHRQFARYTDYEQWNPSFYLKQQTGMVPDYFQDEMALCLETQNGLVVVAGCSHPGIINMLTTISTRMGKKIYGVIGGTHLIHAPQERLVRTMTDLDALGVKMIGVSHCTGDENIDLLRSHYGDKFVFNCTANTMEI